MSVLFMPLLAAFSQRYGDGFRSPKNVAVAEASNLLREVMLGSRFCSIAHLVWLVFQMRTRLAEQRIARSGRCAVGE